MSEAPKLTPLTLWSTMNQHLAHLPYSKSTATQAVGWLYHLHIFAIVASGLWGLYYMSSVFAGNSRLPVSKVRKYGMLAVPFLVNVAATIALVVAAFAASPSADKQLEMGGDVEFAAHPLVIYVILANAATAMLVYAACVGMLYAGANKGSLRGWKKFIPMGTAGALGVAIALVVAIVASAM